MSFINDPDLAPPGSRANLVNLNQIPPSIDFGMQIKPEQHRLNDPILTVLPDTMTNEQLAPPVQPSNFSEPIPQQQQQESSTLVCQEVKTLHKLKLLRTKKELNELKLKLDQLPLNPNEIHTLKKSLEHKKRKNKVAVSKKPSVSLKKTIKDEKKPKKVTKKLVKKPTSKPKKKLVKNKFTIKNINKII